MARKVGMGAQPKTEKPEKLKEKIVVLEGKNKELETKGALLETENAELKAKLAVAEEAIKEKATTSGK